MSSTAAAPSNSECHEFRPHLVRPDKCRNCFGDLSKHHSTSGGAAQTNKPPTRKEQGDQTAPGNSSTNSNTTTSNTDARRLEPEEAKRQQTQQQQQQAIRDAAQGECQQCLRKDQELERLRHELDECQRRRLLAEEEGQRARDQLESLESEMEEMHDNFKEEESEQFEQVKQELDACLKNCKILQIRLNKSERQYGQLEQVKQLLEKQLEERTMSCASNASDGDKSNQQQQHCTRQGADFFVQEQDGTGHDWVKLATRDYDQMLRDLNDTSERERDLQEQTKYSQEEAQLKGERLQAIEAENEILLGRISKLTQANSSLRSSMMPSSSNKSPTGSAQQEHTATNRDTGAHLEKVRELCGQNEQLKLALEVAQSESERLKVRIEETQRALEARDQSLGEAAAKLKQLQQGQQQLQLDTSSQHQHQHQHQPGSGPTSNSVANTELECRQLRARLVHSERECRQLRSQLESLGHHQATSTSGRRSATAGLSLRSHSMESGASAEHHVCPSGKCNEITRGLDRQCKALLERNTQLEVKLQRLIELSSQSLDQQTSMESDLFEKLKCQLDTSESELAKARSRLVKLDIECGRAQRQYKRLLSSLETCGSEGGELQLLRRNKLPADSVRDSLSRQELRQAIRELELDLDDMISLVKAKECFIREQQELTSKQLAASESASAAAAAVAPSSDQQQLNATEAEQLKSLRRLLDQEQLLSNNLKLDVAHLEQNNIELETRRQMLERERVAMEEELDKLRQVVGELRAELEESHAEKTRAQSRTRELLETVEKIKVELNQVRQEQHNLEGKQQSRQEPVGSQQQQQTDLLLMARDLSELKVKNGFLMRQLEMARADTTRQLDELRTSHELQQRRAVELAQIELKERHLQESQHLREELNDTKQRLAQLQRQAARQEEETAQERDRARNLERDWRRDKSQWQQTREQLEGQLAIEKRSSEFRLKEAEAATRDKERQLMGVQDRCVQIERDLKRMQNKYHLLEEDSESKVKQLTRDLEIRTKDWQELARQKQMRDEQHSETMRRLTEEKSTLKETLETIKRSYDERLAESRQLRELVQSRQEQAYRERAQHSERIESLTRRLNELSEHEAQVKLMKQRLELQERQLELTRRDLSQLKEERTKLRARCDELEKRELITKTSSISGSVVPSHHHHHSFLRPFSSKSQFAGRAPAPANSSEAAAQEQAPKQGQGQESADNGQQQPLVEKLSGKINDQRNLINILRQQLQATQMELKQMKLLQASERSRWQANLGLLTGRLNECEEKLAFESAMLSKNPTLIDQLARPKLEASWSQERLAQLDLIKQQQAQLELVAKDLKKTSQAHEMLRLHSKQLESHNNKLSKKLIEYQQQHQSSLFNGLHRDRELELNYERLQEQQARLVRDLRPLLEIVGKIVNSLDALGSSGASATHRSFHDSTERPLRPGVAAATATAAATWQESDDSDRECSAVTAKPAYQQQQQPSRLTRLLVGGKPANSSPTRPRSRPEHAPTSEARQTNSRTAQQSQQPKAPAATKTVKRVRVKCSTLGITTTEKRQLEQLLKAIAETLQTQEGLTTMGGPRASRDCEGSPFSPVHLHGRSQARAGSEMSTQSSPGAACMVLMQNRTTTSTSDPPLVSASPTRDQQHSDQSSQQSHASRVHWQLDSDLESERSWSLEPSSGGARTDIYRRFPQATPSSSSGRGHSASVGPMGASLTDYESESSLASDYSVSNLSPNGRRRLRHQAGGSGGGGGAESDSGLATSKVSSSHRKKSSSGGFKRRLTSTLRTISRSITGLGSDTEASSAQHEDRQQQQQEASTKTKRTDLEEIRV